MFKGLTKPSHRLYFGQKCTTLVGVVILIGAIKDLFKENTCFIPIGIEAKIFLLGSVAIVIIPNPGAVGIGIG